MSATILRMPRRRVRKGKTSRLVNLGEMVKAAHEECRGLPHGPELTVLLLYVKADPPAHQLAAELVITAAEAARRLKSAGELMVRSERFAADFHAINSRLD